MVMTRFVIVVIQPAQEADMSTDNTSPSATRTIKASEFKAKRPKLMDEVAENGEEIVITKNGRPTARLVAYRQKPKTWFGADRGKLEIIGVIMSPMDVEWEAEHGLIEGKECSH